MKVQIEIWNGRGWNDYPALRILKSLKRGSRGLAGAQGISIIEVSPRDAERPYGIEARFFGVEDELIFALHFHQNESAEWIKKRIHALLTEGVQNRIAKNAKEAARQDFIRKITAWRTSAPVDWKSNSASIDKLSARFHAARRAALSKSKRPSRSLCTSLVAKVCLGNVTFKEAVAQITAAGGIFQ